MDRAAGSLRAAGLARLQEEAASGPKMSAKGKSYGKNYWHRPGHDKFLRGRNGRIEPKSH